jgi:hypothetical protein
VVERTYWTPDAAAGSASGEGSDSGQDATGGSETTAAPARGSRRPRERPREVRRVDLKKALLRLEPDGDAVWIMEAWLEHPEGQVANPRVVLEQFFQLTPEEQARVRVTRTAILGANGAPVGQE